MDPYPIAWKDNAKQGECSRDAHEHRSLCENAQCAIDRDRLNLPALQSMEKLFRCIRWIERKQVVLQTAAGVRSQFYASSARDE